MTDLVALRKELESLGFGQGVVDETIAQLEMGVTWESLSPEKMEELIKRTVAACDEVLNQGKTPEQIEAECVYMGLLCPNCKFRVAADSDHIELDWTAENRKCDPTCTATCLKCQHTWKCFE